MRKTGLIVGLIVIGFLMWWVRAYYGSMKAYEQGETHLNEHRYVRAVTYFDRSMRWYTPLNPYVGRSAERLWEIGTEAEKQGNIRLSLIATETIRRAFYAARSFYTPGEDWIGKCDAKLRRLAALQETGGPTSKAQESSEEETPRRRGSADPSNLWTMILEFGLLGWIGSVIGFILFACKGNEGWRISALPALLWGSLVVICFALWLIGMMRA